MSGDATTDEHAEAALALALRKLHSVVSLSSEDWEASHSGAAIYGLVVGWECGQPCGEREDPEHYCDQALWEMAARYGWSVAVVAELRAMHAAIAEVVG